MVTFGDKSKSVLTNLRFYQIAVTPSPSVSCFQTFQRVLIQKDHPSSQTTQKGEECVLSLSPYLLHAGSPWLRHCRQVTQVLFLSHLWAEAILGPGVGRKGPAHMLEALPFSSRPCEPSGGPGTVREEERGWAYHALPYSFHGASVVRFSEPFSSTNWCL